MSSRTDAMEFLNDIKFTIMQALYKRGLEFPEAERIAERAKIKIFDRFQGEQLYIPCLRHVSTKAKKEQVLSLHREGKTITEISRLVRLTTRSVYNHLRDRNKADSTARGNGSVGLKDMNEIKLHTAKILLQNGVDSADCKDTCEEVHGFLQKQWAGVTFTLPSMVRGGNGCIFHSKKERAYLVFDDYNGGMSYDALAAKYALGKEQVKGIVKRLKKKGGTESSTYSHDINHQIQ